ncbi:FeoA family protein [Pseudodesulfovibrio piezophilus]|uniref:FeoA family protein n=1 Tax=Pseudodesulfovibrio piezophilus (strain DSM 21447 / JCM 15486 / C1TLV30) TaxID=1322246 RepID=M1WU27_PSEP2|nr:FeoA family protein [Pseudodesulfovibrio piezophilus]CCH50167.1 FeoA family protein [Pseudodesulfovibrio piezophilus C1TLV30]
MSLHKTLSSVGSGQTAFVIAIDADNKAKIRLESMGIIPGIEVDVLNNASGPLIVSVGEGRIMVERRVAKRVLVA